MTGNQKPILQTTVTIIINAPIAEAFDYVVPVDLSHIFPRYKNYPAVVNSTIKADWKTAGLERIVNFEDGTSSQETLVSVTRPESFSYRIYGFSSLQRRLMIDHIEGSWVFADLTDSRTEITWTYKVFAKNWLAYLILKVVALKDLTAILQNALFIIKNDLEQPR